jgi:hypothetical protein
MLGEIRCEGGAYGREISVVEATHCGLRNEGVLKQKLKWRKQFGQRQLERLVGRGGKCEILIRDCPAGLNDL